MNKVEQAESQVRGLSLDELKAFRDWFTQFDADHWDQQIDVDAKSGALRSLAEDAPADKATNMSNPAAGA